MEYRHGGDIYSYPGVLDFSSNVNPFGPSPAVLAAAKKGAEEIGHYPDHDCRELRNAAAEKWDIPPGFLIFGNGAAELLYTLAAAERPRRALLCAPSFSEYTKALRAVGCEIDLYRSEAEKGFALGEDYLQYLTPDIDMAILCSPDNPTGRVHDRSLLERILEKCCRLQIRMVVDESFCEFTDRPDLQPEAAGCPALFLLRAFTKMYAMPGLRLGYGISSDRSLLERMELMRQPWSVSCIAQAAGKAALRKEEDKRVREVRERIAGQRLLMRKALSDMGFKVFPSDANYLLIHSRYELFAPLLERGILIRDCSDYEGLERGYYRIAVRTERENQILLDVLKEILEGRKEEWRSRS